MVSSRQPTAYIHIGPHKTGSSSIKHFCRANRDALTALGLYFPLLLDKNGRPARNHEELGQATEIRRNGELKPGARLWPEIDAAVSEGGIDVLLSSEMLCNSLTVQGMFPRILSYFERRGYRVVILAYVRDQPGWLNSKYVQNQKRMFRQISFEGYCAEVGESGGVDPWRLFKRFIEEPRCRFEAVSFERAISSGLELDFIRRCGIAADADLLDVPLRNPNAGAKSVYAAQEIMRRAGSRLKKLRGYGQVYNGFKKRCAELGFDKTPYVALDQAAYQRIRAQYAPTNETFAQAYFGASWTALCPQRTYAVSTFDPARASRLELAEIEDLIASTVAKFAELEGRSGDRRAGRAEAGWAARARWWPFRQRASAPAALADAKARPHLDG